MVKKIRKPRKKKGKYVPVFIAAIVFIIISFVIIWGNDWVKQKKSAKIKFEAFGIELPSQYEIHGIDVSKYQQTIAWENVRAMNVQDTKLDFAFIKATEGISNSDIFFKRNWERSRKAGIIRGAYHFFISSKDGKQQADNFIKNVDIEIGDLPPVLDVEQKNGRTSSQIKIEIKKWLEKVEEHYQIKPIIYTNVDFYNKNLGSEFDEYPLWVAHYFQQKGPRINRKWILWQHSEKGRVDGIRHRVDFNVFNGDSETFKSLLVK